MSNPPFAIRYSPFAIRYSLFAIRHSLFAIRHWSRTIATGRVHAKFAFITAAAITAGTLAMQEVIPAGPGISLILGGWLGYLIDPDLDALQRTYTEGRVHRYLGRRVGKLWQAIWAPYAVLIDHRSFWSHMPGIGTLLRALWLAGVVAVPLLFFHFFSLAVLDANLMDLLPSALVRLHPQPQWGLWLLGGWTIQDFVHLALDGFNLR